MIIGLTSEHRLKKIYIFSFDRKCDNFIFIFHLTSNKTRSLFVQWNKTIRMLSWTNRTKTTKQTTIGKSLYFLSGKRSETKLFDYLNVNTETVNFGSFRLHTARPYNHNRYWSWYEINWLNYWHKKENNLIKCRQEYILNQ